MVTGRWVSAIRSTRPVSVLAWIESGLAIGVGTELSGESTFPYRSKSEFNNVDFDHQLETPNGTVVPGRQENSGLGVKALMSAGEGATFSVGYPTLKIEQDANDTNAHARDGTAKTRLIGVDFSHDLGGGAKLEGGTGKRDGQELGDSDQTVVDESDTTTLETVIAFSF